MSDEPKRRRLKVDMDSMPNAVSNQSRRSKRLKVKITPMHSVVPNELWINLLKHLNPVDLITMGKTSHRYRVLCMDPSLWKSLVIDWLNIKKNWAALKIAINRGAQVEKLKITNETFPVGLWPYLVLNTPSFQSDMISMILTAKDSLKSLILDSRTMPHIATFGRLTQLEELSFSRLRGEPHMTSSLKPIGNLQNLKKLRITGWNVMTPKAAGELTWLFMKLKNLVVVSLTNCSVTDTTIIALAKNNPNLEHLVLDRSFGIKGTGLISLAEHSKKLKHLSAVACFLDIGIVENMMKNFDHLKYLQISAYPRLKIRF